MDKRIISELLRQIDVLYTESINCPERLYGGGYDTQERYKISDWLQGTYKEVIQKIKNKILECD